MTSGALVDVKGLSLWGDRSAEMMFGPAVAYSWRFFPALSEIFLEPTASPPRQQSSKEKAGPGPPVAAAGRDLAYFYFVLGVLLYLWRRKCRPAGTLGPNYRLRSSRFAKMSTQARPGVRALTMRFTLAYILRYDA